MNRDLNARFNYLQVLVDVFVSKVNRKLLDRKTRIILYLAPISLLHTRSTYKIKISFLFNYFHIFNTKVLSIKFVNNQILHHLILVLRLLNDNRFFNKAREKSEIFNLCIFLNLKSLFINII